MELDWSTESMIEIYLVSAIRRKELYLNTDL